MKLRGVASKKQNPEGNCESSAFNFGRSFLGDHIGSDKVNGMCHSMNYSYFFGELAGKMTHVHLQTNNSI